TFDVVLMDIQMPVMDGVETTLAIRTRERESGGHLPIVGLSAHAMAGDLERYIKQGMDAYATKPIEIEKLLGAMKGAIYGSYPEADRKRGER
ncbi:MAG: CheY-like chemotaxis protein, partial [Candidatus Latescibacterota bacterium]